MNTITIYTFLQRLSVGLVLIALLATGCAQFTSQPMPTLVPSLPASDLLLDARAFPKNWGVDPCEPDCRRREGETKALRVFGIADVPGHVIQEVFRLESVEAAKVKFQTYREVEFRERQSPNKTFTLPPEIHYRSPIADEYYLGCGIDEVPACRAIMRYNSYFIAFYFDIDSGKGDGLKIADVEPVVHALDQLVARRLGLLLPTPAPVPTR